MKSTPTPMRWRHAHGWTLIELMVVMSLITVLAAIPMANYRNAVVTAQEATLKENLFRMRDAIDQYYADKNKYPDSLEALVTDGYLRRIPEDPMTRSADTLQAVPAEPDLAALDAFLVGQRTADPTRFADPVTRHRQASRTS